MFEKEAEERAKEIAAKQTLGVYDNDEDLARDEGWNDGYVVGYEEGFKDGAEFGYNKAKEELEEKISILLSCKNCPENKGGYICQKEYEDKCLAQKIQYIKELQEENAELKEQLVNVRECFIGASSGDDFEMAESAREVMEVLNIPCYRHGKVKSELTKAKELLKQWQQADICDAVVLFAETEDFLKENEQC